MKLMRSIPIGFFLLALIVSSLAQTDAVAKLLIEKGLITEAEFMEKLKAERATYQAMMQGIKGQTA